jgi:hypothetical protein
MKARSIIPLMILCTNIFISCNSNKKNPTSENNVSKQSKAESKTINCYQYTSNADTILLKVIREGDAVTGTLVYNLDGKDKNTGAIQGEMMEDMLVAKYTFMSEGIQSVRQVAFKFKDNTFVEGYGETEVRNNEAAFKDVNNLSFNDSIKLIQTPCE